MEVVRAVRERSRSCPDATDAGCLGMIPVTARLTPPIAADEPRTGPIETASMSASSSFVLGGLASLWRTRCRIRHEPQDHVDIRFFHFFFFLPLDGDTTDISDRCSRIVRVRFKMLDHGLGVEGFRIHGLTSLACRRKTPWRNRCPMPESLRHGDQPRRSALAPTSHGFCVGRRRSLPGPSWAGPATAAVPGGTRSLTAHTTQCRPRSPHAPPIPNSSIGANTQRLILGAMLSPVTWRSREFLLCGAFYVLGGGAHEKRSRTTAWGAHEVLDDGRLHASSTLR